MTMMQSLMEDAVDSTRRPWRKDTLRCWFSDERQYWGVSGVHDDERGNCLLYWPQAGGERFDGEQWRPMRPGDQP